MSGNNGNGNKPPREPDLEPVGGVSSFQMDEQVSSPESKDDIDPRLIDPWGTLNKGFTFPGHEGLPFRGRIPSLKDSDPVQPQVGTQVYVDILDLSNKGDLEKYRQICQVVGNGIATISAEERVYDEDKKNWRVFIRWVLNYTHMPSESDSLFK